MTVILVAAVIILVTVSFTLSFRHYVMKMDTEVRDIA